MNTVSIDIALYLRDIHAYVIGDAGPSNWPVYAGEIPAEKDEAIGLYATGGPDPAITFNASEPNTDYSTFQLRVRGKNSLEVNNQLEILIGLLTQTSHWYVYANAAHDTVPPNGTGMVTHYLDVLPAGSPFDLPRDENNRFVKVTSFRTLREDRQY